MFTALWVLFLAAGVGTVMVGAWRAGFWTDRGIPKGREPWAYVFAALALFVIGQVFLIVDGALHDNLGQSVGSAVAFLLPVATTVYVFRITRNRGRK
ncbi:hypothetical protein [Curtobacterium flaccumfaciens]|uniref:hypothetical protein n=1 Tax=Curtobacterium flaccumfaciens TaxID=2035 RepID=UPI001BDF4BAD|nr:hypothetical protein [Curtobacterium flaccumfaciens]MBT1633262.1 hypothetical protein [Curtobacterium flaccumfaciens pv. oortii]MCX2846909.1 hypothetical protein [Curtobacterium flaccumfaciens pv. oortii]